MSKTEVLVVGAGPTGLYLAHELVRSGVKIRLIDKAPGPGEHSRAVVVQSRTLEFYRLAGLADQVVEQGHKFTFVNLWVGGKRRAQVPFGDLGAGLSAFPYGLIYPQDEHEKFLIAKLADLGVEVERPVELTGFYDVGERIEAHLKGPGGKTETCEADWLAGCDGARSTVRATMGTGFPGGTYSHLFYVADVEASGPMADGQLHIALDTSDFLGVFPLKSEGRARLIGAMRPDAVERHESGDLSWNDVNPNILERLRIEVKKVNWFSTYHVHHRVAARFRTGRAFLLGDAGHIHSPVGGQGMNTGLGDAENLAWKLASVVKGQADERLLDTYDAERIGFARRLVNTTDQLFTIASSNGDFARTVRTEVLPAIAPTLFRLGAMRRFIFLTASQTAIQYRGQALSVGGAGMVRGGDRLPWVPALDGVGDNYAPLDGLGWQAHVYGDASSELEAACCSRGVAFHAFAWRHEMGRAGLMERALYLVRPDGHVGLCDPNARPETLYRYLDQRGLKPEVVQAQAPKRRVRATGKASPPKRRPRTAKASEPGLPS